MDRFFGLDKVGYHEKGLVLLTTVHDQVEMAIVRSILEGAEIPFLPKERGSGGAVKVIAGFSMYGTDLFVPESCYETAKALITPSCDSAEEFGEIADDAASEESEGTREGEDESIE